MPEQQDPVTRKERVSRRRLLGRIARAGAVGAGASVIGGGVMAQPALAGVDGDVVLGQNFQSASTTTGVASSGDTGFYGSSSAPGGIGVRGSGDRGVYGSSFEYGVYGVGNSTVTNVSSVGVHGEGPRLGVEGTTGFGIGVLGSANSDGTGVRGTSSGGDGVEGYGGNAGIGVYGQGGPNNGNGVQGYAGSAGGTGVFGVNVAGGTGVIGAGDAGGIGVHGHGSAVGVRAELTGSGVALDVVGPARFSRSGKKSVAGSAGTPKSSVKITGVALTSASLVVVTPQKNLPGVWVQGAVPNVGTNSITIYLNQAVTQAYPVAWMVIEQP